MAAPVFLLAAALTVLWLMPVLFSGGSGLLDFSVFAAFIGFLLWTVIELHGEWVNRPKRR